MGPFYYVRVVYSERKRRKYLAFGACDYTPGRFDDYPTGLGRYGAEAWLKPEKVKRVVKSDGKYFVVYETSHREFYQKWAISEPPEEFEEVEELEFTMCACGNSLMDIADDSLCPECLYDTEVVGRRVVWRKQ